MKLLGELKVAEQTLEATGERQTAELVATAAAIIRSYRDRLHAANEQALEYQQQISELRGLLAQANADVRYLQGDHLHSNGKQP
jgi:archaellum component FlaC